MCVGVLRMRMRMRMWQPREPRVRLRRRPRKFCAGIRPTVGGATPSLKRCEIEDKEGRNCWILAQGAAELEVGGAGVRHHRHGGHHLRRRAHTPQSYPPRRLARVPNVLAPPVAGRPIRLPARGSVLPHLQPPPPRPAPSRPSSDLLETSSSSSLPNRPPPPAPPSRVLVVGAPASETALSYGAKRSNVKKGDARGRGRGNEEVGTATNTATGDVKSESKVNGRVKRRPMGASSAAYDACTTKRVGNASPGTQGARIEWCEDSSVRHTVRPRPPAHQTLKQAALAFVGFVGDEYSGLKKNVTRGRMKRNKRKGHSRIITRRKLALHLDLRELDERDGGTGGVGVGVAGRASVTEFHFCKKKEENVGEMRRGKKQNEEGRSTCGSASTMLEDPQTKYVRNAHTPKTRVKAQRANWARPKHPPYLAQTQNESTFEGLRARAARASKGHAHLQNVHPPKVGRKRKQRSCAVKAPARAKGPTSKRRSHAPSHPSHLPAHPTSPKKRSTNPATAALNSLPGWRAGRDCGGGDGRCSVDYSRLGDLRGKKTIKRPHRRIDTVYRREDASPGTEGKGANAGVHGRLRHRNARPRIKCTNAEGAAGTKTPSRCRNADALEKEGQGGRRGGEGRTRTQDAQAASRGRRDDEMSARKTRRRGMHERRKYASSDAERCRERKGEAPVESTKTERKECVEAKQKITHLRGLQKLLRKAHESGRSRGGVVLPPPSFVFSFSPAPPASPSTPTFAPAPTRRGRGEEFELDVVFSATSAALSRPPHARKRGRARNVEDVEAGARAEEEVEDGGKVVKVESARVVDEDNGRVANPTKTDVSCGGVTTDAQRTHYFHSNTQKETKKSMCLRVDVRVYAHPAVLRMRETARLDGVGAATSLEGVPEGEMEIEGSKKFKKQMVVVCSPDDFEPVPS
ncbi:hypothetical protein B0H16DRAFT_1861453 [Mycena metata]|uniref:Uncharacterized protein n=1 Tax=Mycena metata TaxID=1033252 RepID=A0AAD7N1W8_9AGAR|nr:hypothetical protein B0H16DRAFT_1861453 [Mycena metata]